MSAKKPPTWKLHTGGASKEVAAPAKAETPKDERTERDAAIGNDYRAGVLSLREIGAKHGVSHVAVKKLADKYGWTRDLSARIQAEADAKVNKAVVTEKVNETARVNERVTIEANANAIAEVRLAHRADIRKARELVQSMLGDLMEISSIDGERLLALIEQAGADPKMAAKALQRVTSLPTRVGMVKPLTEALRNVVAMDREAWGLGAEKQTPEADFETLTDEQLEAKIREHDERRRAANG